MDFTEKLISLVQAHRFLYDHREKDYKNSAKKDKTWEKLAKQLNQNSDTIRTKWKSLKDGYAKYKKNTKDPTGHKKAYANWVWGPSLTFLDGAIQVRSSNKKEEFDNETQYSDNAEDLGVNCAEMNASGYAENTSLEESQLFLDPLASKSRVSRKRRYSEHDDIAEKVLEHLINAEKKDPIDLLFDSYAKSLKQMKPMTQASVKIKLAKVFADAELQDLQAEHQSMIEGYYKSKYEDDC